MTVFRASHSHLFPGATLTVAGTSAECLVIFSDESTADADLTVTAPDGPVLSVQPYTTAAGTRITAKTWQLAEKDPENRPGEFTVTRRL